jgi:hypothetical protein
MSTRREGVCDSLQVDFPKDPDVINGCIFWKSLCAADQSAVRSQWRGVTWPDHKFSALAFIITHSSTPTHFFLHKVINGFQFKMGKQSCGGQFRWDDIPSGLMLLYWWWYQDQPWFRWPTMAQGGMYSIPVTGFTFSSIDNFPQDHENYWRMWMFSLFMNVQD